MRIFKFFVLLSLLTSLDPAGHLSAQSASIVRPGYYRAARQASIAVRLPPSMRMALPRPIEQHLAPLSSEQINAFHPKGTLEAAALHRKLPVEAGAAGSWQETGGGRVWRIALHASGAQALRVHFSGFDVGQGRVWVHDGQGAGGSGEGPYTGRGSYGDGDFWSDIVFGETAVVEYETANPGAGAVPFQIAEISHIFRGFESSATGGQRDAALSCQLDVSCYPEWTESAKSVARMLFETGEGGAYCTGSLLMNQARTYTPYFLTADHCISTDTEARSLVASWLYQSAGCNQASPNVRDAPRSVGARYLTGGPMERGDFTLLQLNDVPDGVVFAGWNSEEVPLGSKLTGIHHPQGDYKRISLGTRREDDPHGFSRNQHYTAVWDSGHTEGGSSGSPVFSEPGVIVGMLSGGLKPPDGETKCDLNPDSSYYGKFSVAYPALRDYLEGRPPVSGGSGSSGKLLASGVGEDFSFTVNTPTLFTGGSGYRVDVPAGATLLQVQVTTAMPNAEVTLFGRYGAPPTVADGGLQADAAVAVVNGSAVLRLDANSSPPLHAGAYYFGLSVLTTTATVQGRITATIASVSVPPAIGTPVALTSGAPWNFSLPAVTGGTLFNGDNGYRVTVPAGATKLEIKVATTTRDADVDLFVRFGADPVVSGGQVTADYNSSSDGGNETVTITASSSPPLKAGTYYIALALFTKGVATSGTITATVETPSIAPPGSTGALLTSGTPREIGIDPIPGSRLFAGETGYRVVVPEGATRLEVRTATSPANADIDLFVSYGSAPGVSQGRVIADFKSDGPSGDEVVIITPSSLPALRAGTYYIGLALFTANTAVKVTLTATASTGSSPSPPVQLTSGIPQRYNVQPVSQPTLVGSPARFQIPVPQGARTLTIRLATASTGVDMDLYARFGSAPEVQDGRVVADYDSSGDGGEETITISSSSSPPLRAGTYYIALGMFTTGMAATGTVTATIETGDSSAAVVLSSGSPRNFLLGPVTGPTLMQLSGAFRIVVPEGAGKLQVHAIASTPAVDVDLYVRYGTPPAVVDGAIVSDYSSTGTGADEAVTVTSASTPPLRPGTYYVTLAVRTAGVEIGGSITATVENAAPQPAGSVLLTSGIPAKFALPAVDSPTLFTGDYGFRIEVPQGATRLQVKLLTTTPNVDADLFLRYGADVDLTDGDVVADYDSSGDTGNETITVTLDSSKPLQAGVYYIASALFTTGVAADGRIVATVESAPALPVPSGGIDLNPGVQTDFLFSSVSQPTLFTGANAYRLVVPEGATGVTVRIASTADTAIFVRYGTMPEVANGRVVADYSSASGSAQCTFNGSSTPPLRPGVHFIAIAAYTTGAPVSGTIGATMLGTQSVSEALEKGLAPLRAPVKLFAYPDGEQVLRVDEVAGAEGVPLADKTEYGKSRAVRKRCVEAGRCY